MRTLRKFTLDTADISETIALVFGTLLALLVINDIAEDFQLIWAWIVFSMLALRGFTTILIWIIDRRLVSEE